MIWAALAIGIASAAAGAIGASKQKDIEEERVELSYQDNLEKIRRRKLQMNQTQGAATAFSQSAGVRHTGGSTAQGVLDTMAMEFKREIDWMKDYADKAKRLGIKAADASYDANIMGALTGGVQTGLSVYGARS